MKHEHLIDYLNIVAFCFAYAGLIYFVLGGAN